MSENEFDWEKDYERSLNEELAGYHLVRVDPPVVYKWEPERHGPYRFDDIVCSWNIKDRFGEDALTPWQTPANCWEHASPPQYDEDLNEIVALIERIIPEARWELKQWQDTLYTATLHVNKFDYYGNEKRPALALSMALRDYLVHIGQL